MPQEPKSIQDRIDDLKRDVHLLGGIVPMCTIPEAGLYNLLEEVDKLKKRLGIQESMERIEAQVQTFEHRQYARKLEDVILNLHDAMVTKQKREEHALGCPWCHDFNIVIESHKPLIKKIVDGRK